MLPRRWPVLQRSPCSCKLTIINILHVPLKHSPPARAGALSSGALLGEFALSSDGEIRFSNGRACAGLSAADRERV